MMDGVLDRKIAPFLECNDDDTFDYCKEMRYVFGEVVSISKYWDDIQIGKSKSIWGK